MFILILHFRYVGAGGIINLIIEGLSVLITIGIVVQEIIKIKKYGIRDYFGAFWNVITLSAVTMVLTAVGLYAWRSILTVTTLNKVMNNQGKHECLIWAF